MSVASSPSDAIAVAATPYTALASIRATAGVRLAAVAADDSRTRIGRLAEWGGYRARFPTRRDGVLEAVIVNTGGGLVGGDSVTMSIEAGAGTDTVVTTTAPERVYRSLGTASEVDLALTLAAGARLAWLPQPTTMYSGARLKRRFEIDLSGDAVLVAAEQVVFGRLASGEQVESGLIHDVWRVRREGRLVWADAQRLDGDIAALLARPAIGGGARATGLALCFAPDAASRLEAVRAGLNGARSLAAASAWDGTLAVRLVAATADVLRADLIRVLEILEGRPLPRVWSS